MHRSALATGCLSYLKQMTAVMKPMSAFSYHDNSLVSIASYMLQYTYIRALSMRDF